GALGLVVSSQQCENSHIAIMPCPRARSASIYRSARRRQREAAPGDTATDLTGGGRGAAESRGTMSKLYRDDASVLRTQPLGAAGRIITLLTRRHGKARAVAKGVRRTGSRFGARLEPFTLVDVQLYAGRSLHTVTQVVTIETFAQAISADYGRF